METIKSINYCNIQYLEIKILVSKQNRYKE